ncbi:chemotaxis protein CheW [Sphingomonas sp. Mn802worker]|uniref:chemotaxis protein CheW n=1 Tax=Sphingomonas sp. Mn802worker TaxID=629773 RepID=UPI00035D78C3|nr:chemotaxis protein CheW [Sphingomonas sp. Mn802worker]
MNEPTLHLLAHVAGRGILFDAAQIDSVVDLPAVQPAPGAPATIRGLAALRSRVATVIETRRVLDLPGDDQAASRGVVTMVDGHLYAIAVDTLEDVATVTIAPPPAGMALEGGWSAVRGVAEGSGETLMLLDVKRLVELAAA